MAIPSHIPVTIELVLAYEAITTRPEDWLGDGRIVMEGLTASGALLPGRRPTGDDLLRFLQSREGIGAARQLRLLGFARRLLDLLFMPVAWTISLRTYRDALVVVKREQRAHAIPISKSGEATAITIYDLVPEDPTELGDAVDRLAMLVSECFAGRGQEATWISFRSIRRRKDGYYLDNIWTKTTGRTFRLSQEVIEASNHIATLPGGWGRHRIGIDPDENLQTCGDALVPRLSTRRNRVLPGFYHRQWFGKMLRGRVRAYCVANKVSRALTERVVKLIGGRAMRRGRNVENARNGASAARHRHDSNLLTPALHVLYSEAMDPEGTLAQTTILGMFGAAIRGELSGC